MSGLNLNKGTSGASVNKTPGSKVVGGKDKSIMSGSKGGSSSVKNNKGS